MKDMKSFTLTSHDLEGQIHLSQAFKHEECEGENISPHLKWVNPPEGTESFAVTVYDPDAPTGSGWWHWVIFDIPKDVYELPADAGNLRRHLAPPGAIQSINDYLTHGYGGPFPPKGDKAHSYIFTVYALDVRSLGLNKDASPAMVGFNLHAHTLARASMISYFERK
ncbi:MAG: YbhB/YbcL family Raf kinase inhibitor-like protein [Bacteroidales bacterium]